MRAFWAAAYIFTTAAGAAIGEEGVVSGNDLHGFCTASTEGKISYCYGYIVGAYEGLVRGSATWAHIDNLGVEITDEEITALAHVGLGFCPPQGATMLQIVDIILNYIADNPALRHNPARSLIVNSLSEAFPC